MPASCPTASSSASTRESWCARPSGAEYTALRPTLEDFVIEMPRGAQVIYPKDLGTDLHAGRHRPRRAGVRERHRVGRAVDDDAALGRRRSSATRSVRTSPTAPARTSASSSARACSTATTSTSRQLRGDRRRRAVRPGRARPARAVAGRSPRRAAAAAGGVLVRLHAVDHAGRAAPRGAGRGRWIDARTIEVLHRGWHIDGQAVRPDHRMVAHTAS